MSTAVLISGQMRTVRQCAPSILAAFPGADIYVHAVADERAMDALSLKPRCLVIEPQHEMQERREYTWQLGRGCHGVQRVLKQLWGLRRAWEVYAAQGVHHDWIVRCRPDLDFTTAPESEADRCGGIMVPRFCNYWGLNDRFAIIRREAAERYFTRWDLLDRYIDDRGMFHPETFLAWTMRGFAVRRTRAVFDTIRLDGDRDRPEYGIQWGDTETPTSC